MNKLYKVLLRHCSPKDSVEVVYSYVIANNDEQVMFAIDNNLNNKIWQDQHLEEEDNYDISIYNDEDEKYVILGNGKNLDKKMIFKGDFNDPNVSYDDAYYGIKHWGWSDAILIDDVELETLLKLQIAIDWRNVEIPEID
jgi:hypothetical protein